MSPVLTTNLLLLLLAMLWCGSCHSASDVNLYEQKVERLVSIGDYESALKVGKKSLNSNRRLSNLRMYALSRIDSLPDHLFDFPQYYGINGLLCVSDTNDVYYRIDAVDICSYLGLNKLSNIKSTEQFFNEVVYNQQLSIDSLMGVELYKSSNPDSLKDDVRNRYNNLKIAKRRIDDYILCGLLLERKLDRFKIQINKSYGFNVNSDSIVPATKLPKHYREALVMVYPNIEDTLMLKQYDDYLKLKDQYKDSVVCSNRTRRVYGNTFWWYYDNPSISLTNN